MASEDHPQIGSSSSAVAWAARHPRSQAFEVFLGSIPKAEGYAARPSGSLVQFQVFDDHTSKREGSILKAARGRDEGTRFTLISDRFVSQRSAGEDATAHRSPPSRSHTSFPSILPTPRAGKESAFLFFPLGVWSRRGGFVSTEHPYSPAA
ncbi:MAG: hypothetical protein D6795_19935 [Deltaproteobacteria bacterium]|nr:MAG: hypothetical protein D6795_19935 [Deltaproteobacteria bacterium]